MNQSSWIGLKFVPALALLLCSAFLVDSVWANSHRQAGGPVDLAGLLSPETVAYMEFGPPSHFGPLMGGESGLEASRGLLVSSAISPAWIELSRHLRGGAIGCLPGSSPEQLGPALIVLALESADAGEAFLRGLQAQGSLASESVLGCKTVREPAGRMVTTTQGLVIACSEPEQIRHSIERLRDPALPSLADEEAFGLDRSHRQSALASVFLAGEGIRPFQLSQLSRLIGPSSAEFLADTVLNGDDVRCLSGALLAEELAPVLDIQIRFRDDEQGQPLHSTNRPSLQVSHVRKMPRDVSILWSATLREPGTAPSPTPGSLGDDPGFSDLVSASLKFANQVSVFVISAGSTAPIPGLAFTLELDHAEAFGKLLKPVIAKWSNESEGSELSHKTVSVSKYEADRYRILDLAVHVVEEEGELIITMSRETLWTLSSDRRKGLSIRDNPAFADGIPQTLDLTSGLFIVTPSKIAPMAKMFMPHTYSARVDALANILQPTTVTLEYGQREGRWSASLRFLQLPSFQAIQQLLNEVPIRPYRKAKFGGRFGSRPNPDNEQ